MKRTLKESIGVAVSHGVSPGTIDRIGALAHAGKLGIILWHWKYANEPRGIEAENLLTRRAAKRLKIRHVGKQIRDYAILRMACRQVLMEWYLPECPVCNGVKELQGEHKRVVCDACEGFGLKRFNDYERALKLGIELPEYKKDWDRRFREIRDMVVAQDAGTGAIVREQLRNVA